MHAAPSVHNKTMSDKTSLCGLYRVGIADGAKYPPRLCVGSSIVRPYVRIGLICPRGFRSLIVRSLSVLD